MLVHLDQHKCLVSTTPPGDLLRSSCIEFPPISTFNYIQPSFISLSTTWSNDRVLWDVSFAKELMSHVEDNQSVGLMHALYALKPNSKLRPPLLNIILSFVHPRLSFIPSAQWKEKSKWWRITFAIHAQSTYWQPLVISLVVPLLRTHTIPNSIYNDAFN